MRTVNGDGDARTITVFGVDRFRQACVVRAKLQLERTPSNREALFESLYSHLLLPVERELVVEQFMESALGFGPVIVNSAAKHNAPNRRDECNGRNQYHLGTARPHSRPLNNEEGAS